MPSVKSAVTAPNGLLLFPLHKRLEFPSASLALYFGTYSRAVLGEKSRVWGFFVFYHFGYCTIKTEVTKSFSLEGQEVDTERCEDLMCFCSSLYKHWRESHISQPGFPTDCRLPKHFTQSEL